MSEKINIYEKLASIQSTLLATKITKSGKNKHNGSEYYELEDLLPPVQIACKQMRILTYFDFPFDLEYMQTKAELHLINLDDLDEHLIYQVPFPQLEKINNGMNIMQSEGSYLTYLKRYLLIDTFQLTEKEVIDSMDWDKNRNEDTANQGIVIDERPSALQKVIDRCHSDFSEEECNVKLLNKVSLQMFKEKEITKSEREEIFKYLRDKKD